MSIISINTKHADCARMIPSNAYGIMDEQVIILIETVGKYTVRLGYNAKMVKDGDSNQTCFKPYLDRNTRLRPLSSNKCFPNDH